MINLSNLPIGVQVIDAGMRYVFLNEKLLGQVGKTLEEHVGKRMEEVYPGIENSEIYQAILECHKTGIPQRIHNEYVMPDEKLTYWELDIQKLGDEVIIMSRDITASAKGEYLLLKSNKRLEEEVKSRTHELTESNLKYKKLLSQLSHDIRGPVGNVRKLMEMLRSDDLVEKDADKISDMVRKMTDTVLGLLERILDDAAVSSGKIQLKKSQHVLYDIFEERLKALQAVGKLDNFQVSLNADKTLTRNVDPTRMTQVFDNLLTNAIRYAVPGSTIEIQLSHDGVFSIKNKIDTEKVQTARLSNRVDVSAGFGQEIIAYILEGHHAALTIIQHDQYYEASFQLPKSD